MNDNNTKEQQILCAVQALTMSLQEAERIMQNALDRFQYTMERIQDA